LNHFEDEIDTIKFEIALQPFGQHNLILWYNFKYIL